MYVEVRRVLELCPQLYLLSTPPIPLPLLLRTLEPAPVYCEMDDRRAFDVPHILVDGIEDSPNAGLDMRRMATAIEVDVVLTMIVNFMSSSPYLLLSWTCSYIDLYVSPRLPLYIDGTPTLMIDVTDVLEQKWGRYVVFTGSIIDMNLVHSVWSYRDSLFTVVPEKIVSSEKDNCETDDPKNLF